MRDGSVAAPRWFGDDPVIEVFADTGGGLAAGAPRRRTTAANLTDSPGRPRRAGPARERPLTVAVDPVLGRVAFRDGVLPDGGRGDRDRTPHRARLGAGPYDRATCVETTDLMARADLVPRRRPGRRPGARCASSRR